MVTIKSDEIEFNHFNLMDIMYVVSKFVLHIVDKDTFWNYVMLMSGWESTYDI